MVKIWQNLSNKKAELRIKKISHFGVGQKCCKMISSAISDVVKKLLTDLFVTFAM